ncbi:MAG: FlgD immunoglobulin-like domain containing protein [bacterium]
MKKIFCSVLVLGFLFRPLLAQYTSEWTSNNLGQYGWGGSFGYDIDSDGLVEFEVRTAGEFRFYNGNYTIEWAIPFSGYDYVNITHPRDIDGDGILTPLNTDADGSGELIVTGFYISGSTYYGRFRIYDASSHSLEYESPLITGFYGSATQEDIDGDGQDEIIIVRFGSTTTTSYVDVYTYSGGGVNEQNKTYDRLSSIMTTPNPTSHQTIISFSVTKQESEQPIDITIYDEIGRQVKSLWQSEKCVQGDYRLVWDGTDNNDVSVPSGAYFVWIKKREKLETKQIQIIR